MTEKLLTIIAEEAGRTVRLDTDLDSLGMDSLEFVCLMQRIGEAFRDIPAEEWGQLTTVRDILHALEKPQA